MNGVIDWGWVQRNLTMIAQLTGEHVILSIIPVLAAFVISIPLGYLVFRTGRFANFVLALLGVVYGLAQAGHWLRQRTQSPADPAEA